MNTKKKVFAGNWSGVSPKLGEELGLFHLIFQRSNLNGETPKSRLGDADSRWGDVSSLQFKYCSWQWCEGSRTVVICQLNSLFILREYFQKYFYLSSFKMITFLLLLKYFFDQYFVLYFK